jgi:NADH-quinone oxidoreductase subunit J
MQTLETIFIILCLGLMVAAGCGVMMFRSLIKAAICLAFASVFLAIVLFLQGAYWAALFELSVCAGLITAVFISAISFITAAMQNKEHAGRDHQARFKLLPYLMVFSGLALLALLILSGFSLEFPVPTASGFAEFKQVLWDSRQTDIIAQIALILAGSFAVIVLFKERDVNDND